MNYNIEWVKHLAVYKDMLKIFKEAEDIVRDIINCEKPRLLKSTPLEHIVQEPQLRSPVILSSRLRMRCSAIQIYRVSEWCPAMVKVWSGLRGSDWDGRASS